METVSPSACAVVWTEGKDRSFRMALPEAMEESISTLEESLTKLEEELEPLMNTPWEQLTR